jgi:hypothetical protein
MKKANHMMFILQEFLLEPLPANFKVESASRKPKRKKVNIVDVQTMLTDNEMVKQMRDYSALVKTHEQIRHEAEVSRQPKIADLVSPRPFQLKGLNEQLFSLFDTLNDPPVSERRLSFAEATRDHNFTYGFSTIENKKKDRTHFLGDSAHVVSISTRHWSSGNRHPRRTKKARINSSSNSRWRWQRRALAEKCLWQDFQMR